MKQTLWIGIFLLLTATLGYGMGQSKGVMVYDLMSEHPAEFWFEDRKDNEFCHAIEWNDTGKMGRMLKEGFEINRQGRQGMTFLIYAYLKNDKRSYEFLLKNGANPNLMMVSDERLSGRASSLKFKLTALTMAAEDGTDPYYLGMGLKYGGNPNIIIDNVHILYFAILVHSFTNVELLMGAGSDVNGMEKEEGTSTPILHAIYSSQYDMAYYFYQKGANPELSKDSIIYMIEETYTGREQLVYKKKLKEVLELRGFDFSQENIRRIEAAQKERRRRLEQD